MFNHRHRAAGFTLIELMVVTLVVAILTSIAVPAYQGQVRRSRRAAVESFLMDVGTRQQQRFLDVRSYAASLEELGFATPEGVAKHYTIAIVPIAGPPPGYRIEATPKGTQVKDTTCTPITLDQAGVRAPATCW